MRYRQLVPSTAVPATAPLCGSPWFCGWRGLIHERLHRVEEGAVVLLVDVVDVPQPGLAHLRAHRVLAEPLLARDVGAARCVDSSAMQFRSTYPRWFPQSVRHNWRGNALIPAEWIEANRPN